MKEEMGNDSGKARCLQEETKENQVSTENKRDRKS